MKQPQILLAALGLCALLAGCGSPAPEEALPPIPTEPATFAAAKAPDLTESTEAPTEPVPFVPEITPVIAQPQTTVTVTTPDEFLAAIAPDTEIIVDAELMDLSQAANYGTGSGSFYRWVETFDGPELYLSGVSNLTIRGSGEDRTANVLSAVPRYANVLNFENCANILVQNLTAGHTQEPGSCAGGVLAFINCQDVLVENCVLFGCGTLGVKAYNSKNMQIVRNEIYECSVGGVEFTNCDTVNVDDNIFRDLGGPIFRIYDCGTITCNGEEAVPFR